MKSTDLKYFILRKKAVLRDNVTKDLVLLWIANFTGIWRDITQVTQKQ